MPSASRKGDSLSTGHGCTGVTTLATPGQGTVFINGILAARVGDSTVSHTIAPPLCPSHVAAVNAGSGSVFIVGPAAARVGDSTDAGAMISGSSNVFIGG